MYVCDIIVDKFSAEDTHVCVLTVKMNVNTLNYSVCLHSRVLYRNVHAHDNLALVLMESEHLIAKWFYYRYHIQILWRRIPNGLDESSSI